MPLSFEELTEQALKLSDDQKNELIDRLLAGISPEEQAVIDKAWAEEVERRLDRYERGEMELVSAEEVFRRLDARSKS